VAMVGAAKWKPSCCPCLPSLHLIASEAFPIPIPLFNPIVLLIAPIHRTINGIQKTGKLYSFIHYSTFFATQFPMSSAVNHVSVSFTEKICSMMYTSGCPRDGFKFASSFLIPSVISSPSDQPLFQYHQSYSIVMSAVD